MSSPITRQQFDALLKDELAPELRQRGFQGSGRNFYRSHRDNLFQEVLNIQSSQWNGPGLLSYTYYVNHGIQVNLEVSKPCPRRGETAAQFRTRLSPTDGEAWEATTPSQTSQQLRQVLEKLDTDGQDFVGYLTELNGPLGALTTDQLATILSPNDRTGWTTLVRKIGLFQPMALLLILARLYYLANDTERAKEFSEWALRRFHPFSEAYAKPYHAKFRSFARGEFA